MLFGRRGGGIKRLVHPSTLVEKGWPTLKVWKSNRRSGICQLPAATPRSGGAQQGGPGGPQAFRVGDTGGGKAPAGRSKTAHRVLGAKPLAGREGFEPPTGGLKVRCATSYANGPARPPTRVF